LQIDGIYWHINITSLNAVIVNTFHFNALNVNRRTILSLTPPSTGVHFPVTTQKFVPVLASYPHVSHGNVTKAEKLEV